MQASLSLYNLFNSAIAGSACVVDVVFVFCCLLLFVVGILFVGLSFCRSGAANGARRKALKAVIRQWLVTEIILQRSDWYISVL